MRGLFFCPDAAMGRGTRLRVLLTDAQTSHTYVLHLFSSAAYNTIASSTSPTNTTSNFGDFLDGFLSGTHLVVEVQHVLLRL
jgi:hypothetical protein